jgi:hypothetical protein
MATLSQTPAAPKVPVHLDPGRGSELSALRLPESALAPKAQYSFAPVMCVPRDA